ncbi:DUF2752 domain-containing protein [Streptomyces sclerotialus]|uniref:DUF2752 domain-containing protein n=1 Tax=Streptomyces sclerotialus TaxID=1957 RepID=UPI00068F0ABD
MASHRTTARTRIEAWSGAALLATLAVLVTAVDPHEPGHYPTCPFRAATGWSCPGCGSLRALNDLVTGHFTEALGHNAAMVAALPVAIVCWLRVVSGRAGTGPAAPAWSAPAVLAGLLLWTVARNLPPLRAALSAP